MYHRLPDDSISYNIAISNARLSFGTSHIDSDLGQTTVPFIDIQDVTTSKPYPMSGVGLYYRATGNKGYKYYTGFLALKLKTYNFSQNLAYKF